VIGAAVWFIDRWEPEPVVMYVIAIGWGAGVSVLVSFDGNGWWSQRVLGMAANSAQYDVMTKAVGAAIIEEFMTIGTTGDTFFIALWVLCTVLSLIGLAHLLRNDNRDISDGALL